MRTRKAWLVTIKDYDNPQIVYAPTAGMARSKAWRSIEGDNLRIVDLVARRAEFHDHNLPDLHELVYKLSEYEKETLLHAFGADGNPEKAGYRDYYYTNHDHPTMGILVNWGLMSILPGNNYGEGMTYFVLTEFGKEVTLSMVSEY
jgi:hypothetical protein